MPRSSGRTGRTAKGSAALLDERWFQKTHFDATVEGARFRWQTSAPYVRHREMTLLRHLAIRPGERVLEVGAGEGANLVNGVLLRDASLVVGLDYARGRAAFLRRVATGSHAVRGDARRLPIASRSFDVVFSRDLLHHLAAPDRQRAVNQMAQCARDGGRVVLIEPNGGRSPIMWLFATVRHVERMMKEMCPDVLENLARSATGAANLWTASEDASVLYRVVLHHQFGFPALGRVGAVRRLLDAWNGLVKRLLPPECHGYAIVGFSVRHRAVRAGSRREDRA